MVESGLRYSTFFASSQARLILLTSEWHHVTLVEVTRKTDKMAPVLCDPAFSSRRQNISKQTKAE